MQKQDLELDLTAVALQMAEYYYRSNMILNFLPDICSSLRLSISKSISKRKKFNLPPSTIAKVWITP